MEEVKPRYWWVEDLVDSDAKAMGTYLALLYLLGPHRLVDYSKTGRPTGDSITNTKEVTSWLAFYFAGRGEDSREAYEAGKEFVYRLFRNEPSKMLYRRYERNDILREIELMFYDKFLEAFKKYLRSDNIPEELRGIVRGVLFDVRSQLYEMIFVTQAGTTAISEAILMKSIESHRGLKGEDTNKLVLCLEKSGLALKYFETESRYYGNAYIFPAPCLSNEVVTFFIPLPPALERLNEKPSGKILEEIVTYVFKGLGFNVESNYKPPARKGSQIEVDVWAWKMFDNIKFSVYVSCKNWDKRIGSQVINEETGRVMNLNEMPQLKIIIAKEVNDDAKELAKVNGFVVIELGEKATAKNAKEIYELVYRALNKIFITSRS
jgi:hypothetical protein